MIVRDFVTQRFHSYPCETKSFQETNERLQQFFEPKSRSKVTFILTNHWYLAKLVTICAGISVHRPLTVQKQSGIAERAVRRIHEGTSAVLLQSGLDEHWSADSMEWYYHLRNMQDRLSDGKNTIRKALGWIILESPSSGHHSSCAHFPKNRYCEICQRTKIKRAPCRRRIGGVVPRAVAGDNYSGSQNSQWWKWFSPQSSICNCGTRLSYSMDSILSV